MWRNHKHFKVPPSDQQRSLTPTVNVLDAAHGKYEPPRLNVSSHGGGRGGAGGAATRAERWIRCRMADGHVSLHLQQPGGVMDGGLIVFGGKDLKAAAQPG